MKMLPFFDFHVNRFFSIADRFAVTVGQVVSECNYNILYI